MGGPTDDDAAEWTQRMSQPASPTFTVFTPTYQRASTLPRVKAALEAQTFGDLEWLIVDDGSTDGTPELVEGWLASSRLDIRYIWQENAGKHVAFNRGVREARGELFLTLDSDDECVPEALEIFLSRWHSIPESERGSFSAVTGLCVDEAGNIVGQPFPRDPYDSDPLHIYFGGVGRGEKWGFQRTDVLRAFPYPEPAGVRFISEAVVWFAIAREYKTRYVNDRLRTYHADVTGARLSHLNRTTALGRLVFHRDVVTAYIDFLPMAPLAMAKSAINCSRYAFHCGMWPLRLANGEHPVASRLLVAAFMLPGAIVFARDQVRRLRTVR
jgi:glycosyltransferase involved in cell wall biosynthesis